MFQQDPSYGVDTKGDDNGKGQPYFDDGSIEFVTYINKRLILIFKNTVIVSNARFARCNLGYILLNKFKRWVWFHVSKFCQYEKKIENSLKYMRLCWERLSRFTGLCLRRRKAVWVLLEGDSRRRFKTPFCMRKQIRWESDIN